MSNASRAALTSMLKTGKIGVWKTPERLDAMRFCTCQQKLDTGMRVLDL